jgi:DNA-binding NtrC family response regulator
MWRGCRRHRANFESSIAHRAELTSSSPWHSDCVCRDAVNTPTAHAQVARNGFVKPAGPALAPPPPAPKPVVGFHGAVSEFKRRLIEATLTQSGGNRTRAAKALGLQRTYLLRLMREFQVHVPASQSAQRRPPATSTGVPPREPSWR